MFSKFFVLGPRGDTLVAKDYRGITSNIDTADEFWRISQKQEPAPVFTHEGVQFFSRKENNIYFVLTTHENVSPSFGCELLSRISKIIKDYCGQLSEEAIRLNFILCYELLDEMMDFGFPQGTSTEILKAYVYCEPTSVEGNSALAQGLSALANFRLGDKKTVSSGAAHKPISTVGRSNRNELFVDVVEELSAVLDSEGGPVSMSIAGKVNMKSYLQGCPLLHIAFNPDLVIPNAPNQYGQVELLDYNFHQAVMADSFAHTKAISLYPPEGETTVMQYRAACKQALPIKVMTHFADGDRLKHDLVIQVRCDLPAKNNAVDLKVVIPVSKRISSVSTSMNEPVPGIGSAQFDKNKHAVVWNAGTIQGGSQHALRCSMVLDNDDPVTINVEVPRAMVTFNVPMLTASDTTITSLNFSDVGKSFNPNKWIRFMTNVNSYVVRMA